MRTILLALAALSMVSQPAAAQAGPAPTQAVDVHAELYAVMEAGVDEDAVLDNLVAAFAEQMATADAGLAELEADSPGLIQEIADAMRPLFAKYSRRIRPEYTPRFVKLLRESLSSEEALAVTRFYRSDIGQTLLRNVSRQLDQTAVLADGLAERDVTRESVEADSDRTVERTLLGLSDAQREELNAAVANTPALLKLEQFTSRSLSLRIEMQNAPLTAEEEAEITRMVETVIERRLGDG